jgi:hypothetical protein
MAKKNAIFRYTVECNGINRSLMSISESKSNGDINVNVKPAPFHRSSPQSVALEDRILSHMFSIHPTNDNKAGQLITSKRRLASGRLVKTVLWSDAIKTHDKFAPVFFRRLPDPASNEMPIDDGKVESISIGKIDSNFFSLFIGFFVSRADRKFDPFGADFQVHQRVVGKCNLVLLASFVSIPSIPHGDMQCLLTSKYDTGKSEFADFEVSKLGLDEDGAVEQFSLACSSSIETYIANLRNSGILLTQQFRSRISLFTRGELSSNPDASEHFRTHGPMRIVRFG